MLFLFIIIKDMNILISFLINIIMPDREDSMIFCQFHTKTPKLYYMKQNTSKFKSYIMKYFFGTCSIWFISNLLSIRILNYSLFHWINAYLNCLRMCRIVTYTILITAIKQIILINNIVTKFM